MVGWPDIIEQGPVPIRDYWNFRQKLTIHNGILFKSNCIIIPRALRPEVISCLHSSHVGVKGCTRKAIDYIYWLTMSSDIKEAVTRRQGYAEYQANNPYKSMQTHKISLYTMESPGGRPVHPIVQRLRRLR